MDLSEKKRSIAERLDGRAPQAGVHRYYPPGADPHARDDSVWTLQRQLLDASRRTTVAAEVDDIVAAITAPRP